MGVIEMQANELRDSREEMMNAQVRFKEDIQNMLFEQKHLMIGSMTKIYQKHLMEKMGPQQKESEHGTMEEKGSQNMDQQMVQLQEFSNDSKSEKIANGDQ